MIGHIALFIAALIAASAAALGFPSRTESETFPATVQTSTKVHRRRPLSGFLVSPRCLAVWKEEGQMIGHLALFTVVLVVAATAALVFPSRTQSEACSAAGPTSTTVYRQGIDAGRKGFAQARLTARTSC